MIFPIRATAALSLLGFAFAIPSPSAPTSTPLPPSQDPFYTAPAGYESTTPGTILRLRHAPGNLTSTIANCSAAYNIVYRTTDARYRPSWAVTTLFIPSTSTHTALLSYQIPYNTDNVDLSPSYLVYGDVSNLGLDVTTALGRGWYVNVPDHEGPKAAFGAAIGDGLATLDSVRAVLKRGFGLSEGARVAMWGYSGGSLASEVAAELQPVYAPELGFAGTALGGLPSNITAVWDAVSGTYYAGLIPLNMLGAVKVYPAAKEYLLGRLKTEGEYNRTGFLAAGELGPFDAFERYKGQDMWRYFKGGRGDVEAPVFQKVVNENGYMGYRGTPRMPLFIYKAVHDEVTPIDSTHVLVDLYCGVGANILYERNTIGNHLEEMTNGDARALEWLAAVFAGERAEKYGKRGCTIKNVAVNATAAAV